MTVLHSGTTKKYSEQWDAIFGEGKAKKKATASKKKAAPKKTAKKKAKKKA